MHLYFQCKTFHKKNIDKLVQDKFFFFFLQIVKIIGIIILAMLTKLGLVFFLKFDFFYFDPKSENVCSSVLMIGSRHILGFWITK